MGQTIPQLVRGVADLGVVRNTVTHHVSPPRWMTHRGQPGFVVSCACGFASEPYAVARLAVDAGDRHTESTLRARKTGVISRLVRG